MCTTTMKKLRQLVYDDESLHYNYKGTSDGPPLEMEDNIINASKYGGISLTMNETVNKSSCGEKETPRFDYRVLEEIMKTLQKEKYLGDQITSKANSKNTIEARISRGHAVLAQMSSLLSGETKDRNGHDSEKCLVCQLLSFLTLKS